MDLPGVAQCGRCQQSPAGCPDQRGDTAAILAARAFGIGTSWTKLYAGHEDELRGLLWLPDDALTKDGCRWAQPKRGPRKKSCTGTGEEPPAAAADHPPRPRRRPARPSGWTLLRSSPRITGKSGR
jgi:hypothetical protein